MSQPYTYPDVERLVVEYLTEHLGRYEDDITVGVGVPSDWTPESPTHLQVVSDGIFSLDHPVAAHATVRLVARAATTTEAKRIAALAFGVLCAHPGSGGIAGARPFTGPLAARDPETRAELASVTARVTVRSIQIPVGS